MLRFFLKTLVVSALLSSGFVSGQDVKPTAEAPAAPSADELKRLAEQLDAPEYADRQTASQRLAELGKAALPALEKAAQGESREAATRAFDLLKKLHTSREPGNKEAAQEVLQRLAASKSVAARQAKELLEPKPAETPNAEQPAPGVRAVPLRIAGGAFRVGGIAVGGGKRISIKNVNGVKEIEAVEENKTVKINDDPEKGIKVEITEKKDGKEETKKFEAKDADELKKNHPEAHKEYETYSKGIGGAAGGVKIEIGGAAIPLPVPGAVPAPFPVPELPLDPAANKKRIIDRLERMIKELEVQKKRLEEQKAELEKAE